MDKKLYPEWQPKDLPPTVKGNIDNLPKFEKWKPKEGEWVIHQFRDGYNDYSESLAIYHADSNIVPIRPATLSDFTIKKLNNPDTEFRCKVEELLRELHENQINASDEAEYAGANNSFIEKIERLLEKKEGEL
jgi:hypothetical protein